MHIELSPQRRDDGPLSLVRAGDCLIINGQAFDFTDLPEGAVLPRAELDCPLLASDVIRQDGRIRLTLVLPLGARSAPAAAFPAPVIDPPDGPVALPETHLPDLPDHDVPDAHLTAGEA